MSYNVRKLLRKTDVHSSPIALFVLSLVVSQVNADAEPGLSSQSIPASRGVYTIQDLPDSSLDKRARKNDYQAHPAGELVCRPFGLCEPCPADEVGTVSSHHFGKSQKNHVLCTKASFGNWISTIRFHLMSCRYILTI
jgi:hypothetical protein